MEGNPSGPTKPTYISLIESTHGDSHSNSDNNNTSNDYNKSIQNTQTALPAHITITVHTLHTALTTFKAH